MANNSQRISPQDQWLFDGEDNLVGVKNPNVHGQDMLPLLYSVDPVTNVVTADITVTTLTTTGNATLGDAEATDTHVIKGATTLLANSASAALTVTQTGAGNAFVVEDSASTDSTMFAVDTNGRVGIGSAPLYAIDGMSITSSTAFMPQVFIRQATNDASGSYLKFEKTRAGAVVQSGDTLSNMLFYGFDGTQQVAAAGIFSFVDGTPGLNDMPGRLVFSTTADGAATQTERMRIDSAGLITARNSTGLGYGTGSGGTVTQATDKSTAVTLNKPSGQITMNGAALAAGASAVFQLNNSTIANTDVVSVNGYASGNAYTFSTMSVGTGAAIIRVTNVTGGSLSEAVVINFSIGKVATS